MTIRTTTPTRPHEVGDISPHAEIDGTDPNGASTVINEREFALDSWVRRGRPIVVEEPSLRG